MAPTLTRHFAWRDRASSTTLAGSLMTPTTALRDALPRALVAGVALSVVLAAGLARRRGPGATGERGGRGPLDLQTGKVIYEKNAEDDRAPASLVKMMTLYLAYQDLRAGKAGWATRSRSAPTSRGPRASGWVFRPAPGAASTSSGRDGRGLGQRRRRRGGRAPGAETRIGSSAG